MYKLQVRDDLGEDVSLYVGASAECVFLCLLLHPSLLCVHPYIENRFVNPLLYDKRFDTLFFLATVADWRAQVIERIKALAELTRQSPDDSVLEAQSRFYDLWSLLSANTIHRVEGKRSIGKFTTNRNDLFIKRMIGFIQKNFSEKITLDDIARSGTVNTSKCCRIFKQALHKNVFAYLLHFRIRQSLDFLTNECMNITAVAFASGFSAPVTMGKFSSVFLA
jgi:AraC-like DNA-binding protein